MQPAASQKRDIQRVTTGQELQQAVFDGVKHIIISRHLDMGQDPLWDRQFGSIFPSVPKKSMLSVANGTQTITGNCTEPFPDALDPPPSTDTQCVITVFEDFMDNTDTVWVSNVYLRLDGSRSRAVGVHDTPVPFDTSVFFVQNADMYLTHVVMRGLSDLGLEGRGIDMMDPPSWGYPGTARLYARECYFGNFMKAQGSALRLQAGNRATLQRCRFYDSLLLPGGGPAAAPVPSPSDTGPAIAAVSTPHKPNLNPAYAPAALWLHSCEFRNNTPAWLGPVAVNGSVVYSNMRAPAVVDFVERTVQEPVWLRPRSDAAAVAGAAWDSSGFLTEGDAWFRAAVKSFEAAAGTPVPEFAFAPLSRDVTASTPPRGLPLQPPRGPPPTDAPATNPTVVTAQPLPPSAEAPARGDSAADDDRRDIVLIAAAVTGSVGVLLLAVIALYCGLTRSAAAGSSNGNLKQGASSADHAFTDHGGLTPIAARPPAGHLDPYATALTASSPSCGPTVHDGAAAEHAALAMHGPMPHVWPPQLSVPPQSPMAAASHPTSPLAYYTTGAQAYAYPNGHTPRSAPAPALHAPHSPGPPLHAQASLPAPARPKVEAPRTHSAPSAAALAAAAAYPQNVYPYNPGSRPESERSSLAYSQPGLPLSRGPSGGPVPNPAAPPPINTTNAPLSGASRRSAHGHSSHSSQYGGAYPRAPDSASNVPSPPSSYRHPHSPSPPERIQSRFPSKVPRSLMSSRDSSFPYVPPAVLSTLGSTGTAGGGGASCSSAGGSAPRAAARPRSGGGSVRTPPAGAAPPAERDGLDALAAVSAAAHQQRQLGSPLVAAQQWSPAVEATAAGGVAEVQLSDLVTNHGSAAMDTSSRGTVRAGNGMTQPPPADVTSGGKRTAAAAAGRAPAARKPPLRIPLPLITAGVDSKQMPDLTRELTASLARLDTLGGSAMESDHRFTHTEDTGPLPETLKPSSAKHTLHGSRASSLVSGSTRTGSADPGPVEPPPSAALHSSRPSSSASARAAAPGAGPGFVSTSPVSVSPSPSGHDPPASGPPPQHASRMHPAPSSAAVARTVTLDDASSSVGMSHAQLCSALDALTARRAVLQGRYALNGAAPQRLSGQGVVQFAQTQATEAAVSEGAAVKFYLVHAAYDRVASLCSQPALSAVTGAVMEAVKGSAITGCEGVFDGTDGAMPPMVVTRRGVTLEEWAARAQPGVPALGRALAAICGRLADLHACGYVYYAMKPSNVAWLERDGGWQLIDFGRATREGVNVGLTFSLRYAAPELAAAQERGAATLRSHSSADIWALGVAAYELALRRRAFPSYATPAQIRAALTARREGAPASLELPWEQAGAADALGLLRPVVLACLARDPAERPRAHELAAALPRLLEYAAEEAEGGLMHTGQM